MFHTQPRVIYSILASHAVGEILTTTKKMLAETFVVLNFSFKHGKYCGASHKAVAAKSGG